jgi:hypothetical protein
MRAYVYCAQVVPLSPAPVQFAMLRGWLLELCAALFCFKGVQFRKFPIKERVYTFV